jgi:hypothetical protein
MTQKKIDSLTPEQEAQFGVYVDKWKAIGLSTEPVDFEKAKEAVNLAYKLADLPPPGNYHLVDSPIAAVKLIKQLAPKKSESEILSEMSYGNHDAPWLSFYDFFKNVVGVKNLEKIEGLIAISKEMGWLSMYDTDVVIQKRPTEIHFDENNVLHNETGPAIRYADGFSVYSWHGVRIPGDWIEHKNTKLTPKIALTWANLEQRRCACEILGWAKILKDLKAKVIDEDGDPEIGILVEVNLPDIGKEKFLKVLCGTGREFAIPVPPEMKTALEANAWTYDLQPYEYKPEVRT